HPPGAGDQAGRRLGGGRMIARLARWRWLGLAGLALLGLAAAAWSVREPAAAALRRHPYFVIHRVLIQGAEDGLTPEDVRAWIGLTETTTVWDASPAAVRERLEIHPYVARATVKRQFPGTLEIV